MAHRLRAGLLLDAFSRLRQVVGLVKLEYLRVECVAGKTVLAVGPIGRFSYGYKSLLVPITRQSEVRSAYVTMLEKDGWRLDRVDDSREVGKHTLSLGDDPGPYSVAHWIFLREQ